MPAIPRTGTMLVRSPRKGERGALSAQLSFNRFGVVSYLRSLGKIEKKGISVRQD
jgi:hypothetical protein